MQDTFFDLDSIELSAPSTEPQSEHAAAIARRATNQTRARSDAIASWVSARKYAVGKDAALVGVEIVSQHGRLYTVQQLLVRPDGDVSLVLGADGEHKNHLVELAVRADYDGSLLTATGDRFAVRSALPEHGEDSGEACGIEVGDVCVGIAFGPHVVTARRGRWGFARHVGREQEKTACFLGDAIKVPGHFVPGHTPEIAADVFAGAVASGVSSRRSLLTVLLSTPRTVEDVRKLWAEFSRIPPSLRRDVTVLAAFGSIVDVFQFPFATDDWSGVAELDLSYGWRIDVKCEAVHAATGDIVEIGFEWSLKDSEAFAQLFDPGFRCNVIARELDEDRKGPVGSPMLAPASESPRREKKKQVGPAALAELYERAVVLARGRLQDDERAAVSAILAHAGDTKISPDEFSQHGASLAAIVTRLRTEIDAQAHVLLRNPAWTSDDIRAARQLCESSDCFFSQTLAILETILGGYVGVMQVAEVAPGWWVAVNAGDGPRSGSYGAVSVTGYYSLCQSGVQTPMDAAIRFIAAKEEISRLPEQEHIQDVLRWIRGLRVAVEHNCAHNLLAWIDRHRRTRDIRESVAAALSPLNSGDADPRGIALQSVLSVSRWLDDRDQFAATCVGLTLAAKFGEAKSSPTASALFDEREDKTDELATGDGEVSDEGEVDGDEGEE